MSDQTRADLLADMAIEQRERAERTEAENVHLSARVAQLETALRAFLEKWPQVADAVNGVLTLQAVRGYPYNGPSIGDEIEQLKAALAAEEQPRSSSANSAEITPHAAAHLALTRKTDTP